MTAIISFQELKTKLRKKQFSKVVIVSSAPVLKIISWAVSELKKEVATTLITIPDGERAKEWDFLEVLLSKFIEHRLDRDSLVLALGGGSIGDMVGFACSIYLRGVRYISIPTTIIAQVDSAHGGKTGINFKGYKNQIGVFYPPIAIVIEARFLKSLDKNQFIDGLGEIIKVGFIKDSSIINLVQKNDLSRLKQPPLLGRLITKAIKVKLDLVAADPMENGIRLLLNVGHTIGHAVEIKYKLSHGKAVLIGMLKEFAISEKIGYSKKGLTAELRLLLAHLKLNLHADAYFVDTSAIFHDKKIKGDALLFPVVERIGHARVISIPIKEFLQALS